LVAVSLFCEPARTPVSGNTLAERNHVSCKGQGTYACRGPQNDLFGNPIDLCAR
jgi:hypothetical protein